MTHRDSSYYPRRATFFSPILDRAGGFVQRLRDLVAQVPDEVTAMGLIASLLVPGLAIYLRDPGRSGKAALAVCAGLFLVFVAFIGFPFANAAFTLLLSIHVVGVIAYCKPLLAGAHWISRLVISLLLCVMTIALIYVPLPNLLEQRWLVPLRLHGQVVVVHRLRSPSAIKRGEWVAFRVLSEQNHFNNGAGHGNVIVVDGINLSPVLAIPGDHIEFTGKSFSVNGLAQPRRPNMPASGEWTVPEKCWFIWPEVAINGHGIIPEGNLTSAAMEIATVHWDQFLGKAFKHWFGRRQLFA